MDSGIDEAAFDREQALRAFLDEDDDEHQHDDLCDDCARDSIVIDKRLATGQACGVYME